MSVSAPRKLSPKVSLAQALMVPFLVLVFVIMVPASYFSYRKGQQAVNEVASHLRSELCSRIEEHLLGFLQTPHMVNQINANAIRQGLLNPRDITAMERHFWEQVKIFDSVSSIYFGSTMGGLVDAGRDDDTSELYVLTTDGLASGPLAKYAMDSDGNRDKLLMTMPGFDARTRPWFNGAVVERKATWSDIYILYTEQDMAIAASRPVYDEQQRFVGVVSVDLFLAHLSSFLQQLEIGQTGQAFVFERSGLLVASSFAEEMTVSGENGTTLRRIAAAESTSPLIRGAATALVAEFGSYGAVTETQQLEFSIADERHLLQVSPAQMDHGLDWLVVVVIPESDFMGQIRQNNRTTAQLLAAALVLAIAVGYLTARQMARPIVSLNASAQALAQGNWDQPAGHAGQIREISQLTESFNTMADQLRRTVDSLTQEIGERQQTESALRTSEERLDLALRGAELGTWDWDIPTGRVVFNERWAEMLGYSLEEIKPHVSSWEKLVHPDDLPSVVEELTAHLEGHSPIYQTEHRVLAKSGEWRWILDTGKVLVRDAKGQPIRATGTHRDVTERKQAEAALLASNLQLETALDQLKDAQDTLVQQERLAAVGNLAAGIAHDFNNLLTSILGHAELVQISPETPQSAQEQLAHIIVAGQRAAHLVRQILDFARKSMSQPQELDLALCIQETIESLTLAIPENIRLNVTIVPGDYAVRADRAQIQQMLSNLFLNAREAMPAGGDLSIDVSRVAAQGTQSCTGCGQSIQGDWLCVAVTDTGRGIPPELLSLVFEPFFTTKEVGQGSGLGLSQVLGIVKQHGGHISLQSQPDQATTIACYLPPVLP